MTDKQDLIREIHEYVAAHGGENTATHLLVQAASAIQTQAAELEAVGAGGVQSLSQKKATPASVDKAQSAINSGAGGVQALSAAPAVPTSVKGAMWFTKKPVTIQAIQWTGENLREVITFTDGPPDTRSHHAGMAWDAYRDLVARDGLKIYTLEGKMLASPGDWIIRGVKGEMYPCKDEIFRLTYEPVGEVVSASCDHATVRWLHQTSSVGGGDPRNSRAWPKVSGVSRDEGHSRALLVFFAAEPTDDEMRAVHDTLAASPTPPAEQTAITTETGNSASAQGAAITSEFGAVYAELPDPAHRGPDGTGSYFDSFTRDQMRDFADRTHALRIEHTAPKAAPQQKAQEPCGWDGAEEWEKLAWHLCAEENGEDACNDLIWEGGPMPEPWGDRWLKYEGEARRMIALVRTHVPAPQPAPAPLSDDLLEALQEIVEDLEQGAIPNANDPWWRKARNAITAAIAAQEGTP